MEAKGSLLCSQEPASIPRPCVTFRNKLYPYYGEELLAPRPTPKLHYHSLSAARYPPYLEAASSILNPRRRHAAVTGTPHNGGGGCKSLSLSLSPSRVERREWLALQRALSVNWRHPSVG